MITRYIFGDTGGHAKQLFAALEEIGVDVETGHIPADKHIIHVGDLIHKGAESDLIVEFLHKVFLTNPENWTQLIGNHEAMHLGLTSRFIWCNCHPRSLELLWEMRKAGFLSLATSIKGCNLIENSSKDILITHAGLTSLLWHEAGRPRTAEEAAEHINQNEHIYRTPGDMIEGQQRNPRAGVFWASTMRELYYFWEQLGQEMPFHQIHGHNSNYDWEKNNWYRPLPKYMEGNITPLFEQRMTVSKLAQGKGMMIGVDPGFERKEPTVKKQPYLTITRKN